MSKISGQNTKVPSFEPANEVKESKKVAKKEVAKGTPEKDSFEAGKTVETAQKKGATRTLSSAPIDAPKSARKKEATVSVDYKKINETLNEFHVSDADVSKVQTELNKLPPKEYKETIRKMEKDGTLDTFVDNMEPEHRRNFLVNAHNKGDVDINGWKKTGAEDRQGNKVTELHPPSKPQLYKLDPDASPSMKKAVQAENSRIMDDYDKDHTAYSERYTDKLESIRENFRKGGPDAKADAMYEIRKLGMPADKLERGSHFKEGIVSDSYHDVDFKTYRELGNTVDIINGKKPDGTLTFNAGVSYSKGDLATDGKKSEVSLDVKGSKYSQEAEIGAKHTISNKDTGESISTEVKGKVKVEDGELTNLQGSHHTTVGKKVGDTTVNAKFGETVSRDAKGDVETKVDGEYSVKNKFGEGKLNSAGDGSGRLATAKMSKTGEEVKTSHRIGDDDNHVEIGDNVAKVAVKKGDNSLKLGAEMKEGTDLHLGAEGELGGVGIGSGGHADYKTGNFGINGKGSLNGVEVRGGVEFEGVKAETIQRGIDQNYPDESPWQTPHDMSNGKHWNDLTTEQQTYYQARFGFNEKRWESELRSK